MDVLVYTTVSDDQRTGLEQLVRQAAPGIAIESYDTVEALSARLQSPVSERAVAVLYPATRSDLLDIMAIQHLLRDLRIILIAPDQDGETIAMAHQLRPRYLGYVSGDFGGLEAVLAKMVAARNVGKED